MYNPGSMKAEEFIDHDEILETLSYADKHKTDRELIVSILNKAKQMKGLSHREASVLLACELEDQDQAGILRKQNCYVCAVVSFQLLRKRLRLLSLPPEKQTYYKKKADTGRDQG